MAQISDGSKFRGIISGGWIAPLIGRERSVELPSTQILVLASILILIQILDGIFTGMGVVIYGPSIEANPIIRGLIQSWGPVHALVFVKSLAILIVFGLTSLSIYVAWMARAMRIVIGIYLVSAIVPWSVILFQRI